MPMAWLGVRSGDRNNGLRKLRQEADLLSFNRERAIRVRRIVSIADAQGSGMFEITNVTLAQQIDQAIAEAICTGTLTA